MNARQARQRRHQWYYSPCAPFEDPSEPDQAKESTNSLSQTDDPTSPPRKGYQQDALFAGNAVVPSEYRERGISPELSPLNKPECSPEAPAAVESATPAQPATQTDDPTSPPRKGYQQDALFAGNAVVPSEYRERGISPELSPVKKVEPEPRTSPELSPQHKDAPFAGNAVIPSEYQERGIPPEPLPRLKVTPAAQESNATDPPRCQFSFSDGRHCRLPRAKTDPRFCLHHTANNVKAKKARKRSRAGQAIVELQTPSGKLTTATDLNYALSQVFRSLAQDRIRPRSAAALGYLGQLLLQTLPGVKSEFSETFGYRAWDESVKAMLQTGPRSAAATKQPQPPHNEHLTIRPGSSS